VAGAQADRITWFAFAGLGGPCPALFLARRPVGGRRVIPKPAVASRLEDGLAACGQPVVLPGFCLFPGCGYALSGRRVLLRFPHPGPLPGGEGGQGVGLVCSRIWHCLIRATAFATFPSPGTLP